MGGGAASFYQRARVDNQNGAGLSRPFLGTGCDSAAKYFLPVLFGFDMGFADFRDWTGDELDTGPERYRLSLDGYGHCDPVESEGRFQHDRSKRHAGCERK